MISHNANLFKNSSRKETLNYALQNEVHNFDDLALQLKNLIFLLKNSGNCYVSFRIS